MWCCEVIMFWRTASPVVCMGAVWWGLDLCRGVLVAVSGAGIVCFPLVGTALYGGKALYLWSAYI